MASFPCEYVICKPLISTSFANFGQILYSLTIYLFFHVNISQQSGSVWMHISLFWNLFPSDKFKSKFPLLHLLWTDILRQLKQDFFVHHISHFLMFWCLSRRQSKNLVRGWHCGVRVCCWELYNGLSFLILEFRFG